MSDGSKTSPAPSQASKSSKAGGAAKRSQSPLFQHFLFPLSYGVLKLLLLMVERLTPSQAYLFARGIGLCFWVLSSKHRRLVRRNLEIAYGDRFSEAERRKLSREVVQHFFCTTFDILLVPRIAGDGSWRRVLQLDDEQMAFIDGLSRSDGAVAFHTGHMGSWEFVAGIAAFFGKCLDFVYRPIEHPQIDAEVRRLRTFFGNRVYSKQGALRGYTKTLREKGWLGVIADQNAGKGAAFLDYFGIPASTETSYVRLYQRFKPRVIAFFAIREGFDFRFRGEGFFETDVRPDADPLEEEFRIGQWYLDCVQRVAEKYPAQYLWMHKRFTTRPRATPKLYDKLGEAFDRALLKDQPQTPIPARRRL